VVKGVLRLNVLKGALRLKPTKHKLTTIGRRDRRTHEARCDT
jgi:hypothetical protein